MESPEEPASAVARDAERLIHALAQGPGALTIELPAGLPGRARLERVAAAYGLGERVRWVEGAPPVPVSPSFADLVESQYGTGDRPPEVPTGDDSVFRGRRIAVVTNIPTHYRAPLFEGVARRLEAAGAAFRVLFLAPTYRRRAWMTPGPLRFDHRFLRSVGVRLGPERNPFLPLDLGRAIRSFRPDLIVAGGHSPFVTGRLSLDRVPLLIWTGETRATGPAGPLLGLRRAQARRARGAIAYGIASAEALGRLAPGLPVVIGRNTTPVPSVTRTAGQPPRLLSVGELSSSRKGVDLLLEALARLRDLDWTFTVVGGGAALAGLSAQTERLGLAGRVTFTGSVDPAGVGAHYTDADVFVLASRTEPFGLVVVEAMGAGLATLVSEHVGAAPDLCAHDRTALVVRPNSIDAWTAELRRVLSEPEMRSRLGRAAEDTIARRWTMERSIDAFVAGLRLGWSSGG